MFRRVASLILLLAATPLLAAPATGPAETVLETGDDYRIVETPSGALEIHVAADRLDECRLTLAFILAPLAMDDGGTGAATEAAAAGHSAACIAETAY